LTSYVYVWETIGRGVEEPGPADGSRLGRALAGAIIGSAFTAVTLWFMLIASAATLGQHHQPVPSAPRAAAALRPLAGCLAAGLFAGGLVISAVVALPVLLTTTAYVVGVHFGWRRGLSEGVSPAPGASTESWSRSGWPGTLRSWGTRSFPAGWPGAGGAVAALVGAIGLLFLVG